MCADDPPNAMRGTIDRWRDAWGDLHPAWRWGAMLLTVALVLMGLGPPLVDGYRDRRAGRQLVAARDALARGEHVEARELARRVLAANREGAAAALPVLAKAADALDHADVEPALRLMFQPDAPDLAGREDEFWQMAVRRLPSGTVIGLWWSQAPEWRKRPEVIVLLAERLAEEGSVRSLRQVLNTAVPPLNDRLEACRLRLLASGEHDWEKSEFVTGLLQAFEERPAAAKTWCQLLPLLPRDLLLASEARDLAECLEVVAPTIPEASAWQGVLGLTADPSRASVSARRLVEETAPGQRPALVRALMWAGERRVAGEAVGLETPRRERELLLLQLEVLLDDGLTSQAASLLERAARSGADPVRSRLLAARAARLREDPESGPLVEALLEEARSSLKPESCLELARRAEAYGLSALAREAWVDAFLRGRGPLPMAEAVPGLMEAAEARGDEAMFIAFLTRLGTMEASHVEARDYLDYLNLVTGRIDPGQVLAESQRRPVATIDRARRGATLMLACLLLGKVEEARGLEETMAVDWGSAPAGPREVKRLVEYASSRSRERGRWDEGAKLFPSEARLLEGVREMLAEAP